MGVVVEGVIPDSWGTLLAALPLAREGLGEVGQDVPLAGVEHAGLEAVARQHVEPVALDLGVVAVEVDVPNHLGRVDTLEATLGPQATEHVLKGRLVLADLGKGFRRGGSGVQSNNQTITFALRGARLRGG